MLTIQQTSRQRILAVRSLQEEDQQEQHGTTRDTVEQAAQICQREQAIAEEDAFLRQIRKEIRSIPKDPGVFKVEGDKVITLKLAECKIVTNKKRSILKALSPIPIVAGKSTVEIRAPHDHA